MKKDENTEGNYKNKNFIFITTLFNEEYKNIFPNAKLFYSFLLSLHYETPVSEDGIRYIDMTIEDIRDVFNCSHGLAIRMKNNLIAAGLIGVAKQSVKMSGSGRMKIVALYIKKIIE